MISVSADTPLSAVFFFYRLSAYAERRYCIMEVIFMNCPNCGAPINEKQIGESNAYKPISMWGYFGYELMFSIPVVGFILLIVFSTGAAGNINLRNFARSYFCYYIIIAVIIGILLATGTLAAILASVGAQQ